MWDRVGDGIGSKTEMNSDLITILEEVTITLDQLLKSHGQLVEGFFEDNQISQSQDRIEKRRSEIDKERDRIKNIRDVLRHRRELDQLRKKNEKDVTKSPQTETTKKTTGLETISDQGGRVVGYRYQHSKHGVVFMDRNQRVVAREKDGQTFDKNGKYFGKGKQGLRAIGRG